MDLQRKQESIELEEQMLKSGKYAEYVESKDKGVVNGHEEEDAHMETCVVCDEIGQLLMCDTCTVAVHLQCLRPQLKRFCEYHFYFYNYKFTMIANATLVMSK